MDIPALPEKLTPVINYVVQGSENKFTFKFLVVNDDDMYVYQNGVQVPQRNYSITGVGNDTGGEVEINTTLSQLSVGDVITLSRFTLPEQLTEFLRLGDFTAEAVNAEFTRIYQLLQEFRRDIGDGELEAKRLQEQISENRDDINKLGGLSAAAFKGVKEWKKGEKVTDRFQRYFYPNPTQGEPSYTWNAPLASGSNPITMGDSPIGDDNWQQWDVTKEDVTEAKNEIINGSIFNGNDGDTVKVGDIVPVGTTHLRVSIGGRKVVMLMSPALSGVVAGIDNSGADIGGMRTLFSSTFDLKFNTIDDALSYPYLFEGASVRLKERSKGNGGASSWDVVSLSSVTPDGFSVVKYTGVTTLALAFRANGAVSPAHMGAGRDKSDYSDEIQACFDFAESNGIQATGDGKYYVSKGVELKSDFHSFAGMSILTIDDFAESIPVDLNDVSRRVIVINKPNVQVRSLRAENDGMVNLIIGMDYAQHQIKSEDSGASGFKINSLIRSFSIRVTNGRNTTAGLVSGDGYGYNLLAYAPEASKEINALVIDGGEYFGSNGIAIDVGDTRNLMSTTLGPSDFHGTGLRIVNCPTCDQGQIRIDRMLNCFVDVYTERSTAVLPDNAALVLGGAYNNSLRGVEIIGYATDFNYFVLCKDGVSGIHMHNTRSRNIAYSALYLTTDQYDYTYENNQSTNSFGAGQEVHTGVRSGITKNAWFNKTIDVYDLNEGLQKSDGEHIYPDKNVTEGGTNYRYGTSRYRYYKTPKSAVCTISGNNTVVFSSNADVKFFNGGDAVNFSGPGGGLSYVLSVDYENATMKVDTFSYSGSGRIDQQSVVPRIEKVGYQPEPSVNFKDGSVIWNSYTVDLNTTFWVLKQGAWEAKV